MHRNCWSPTSWAPTARRSGSCTSPALTSEASERIIARKTPIKLCGDESARCSGSSRRGPASAFSMSIRCAQHLQPSATSGLSVDPSQLQSRSSRPVARCGCHRMKLGSMSSTLWTAPRYRDKAARTDVDYCASGVVAIHTSAIQSNEAPCGSVHAIGIPFAESRKLPFSPRATVRRAISGNI